MVPPRSYPVFWGGRAAETTTPPLVAQQNECSEERLTRWAGLAGLAGLGGARCCKMQTQGKEDIGAKPNLE
jgi:hypothetical protein